MNRFWAVPLFPDAGQLRRFQTGHLSHLIVAVPLNKPPTHIRGCPRDPPIQHLRHAENLKKSTCGLE